MPSLHNIILTGFSGTGKSGGGGEVARVLGWKFIDTDAEAVRLAGKPIASIFSEDGEEAFRRLEGEVLQQACSGGQRVIATGGGILMDPKNRKLVSDSGLVVGLEATPETIDRRLAARGGSDPEERPLLAGPDPLQRIRDLKGYRQPYYALAHWTVHTDNLSDGQVATEVIRAWQMLKDNLPTTADNPELVAVVTHSSGSYPVRVGWGILDHLGDRVGQLGVGGPAYIISDSTVFPRYGRQAQRSLHDAGIEAHSFIIPAGEGSKTPAIAQAVYDWLAGRRAERRHAILAVGGGVVGDVAGFVAATYLRGMPFVQVPTSMVAMVDASIGGKVAVNLPQAKNLVGSFYQPKLVLADPQALTTLGKRELNEGWAEAIKHGFILDAELVRVFEEHAGELMDLEPGISTEVIRKSMAIKARVVAEDERESGGRRTLLNYGHTMGHALEASTAYGRYLHGEAVSIGMMCAAHLSQGLGMINGHAVERQRGLLKRFNLPVNASDIDSALLFKAMAMDKKTEGGSIRWVLLEDVGKAVTRMDVPRELVTEVVSRLVQEGQETAP